MYIHTLYKHVYVCINKETHIYTYKYMDGHTGISMYNKHIHTNTCANTCTNIIHAHIHTTHISTYKYTYVPIHKQEHTNTGTPYKHISI